MSLLFYRLLDILEVIAPYKHFHKLRQFVNLKLPPGFPVKVGMSVHYYLIHPLSFTIHPLPSTIHPLLSTIHSLPSTIHPLPSTIHPLLSSIHPLSSTIHPLPSTIHPLLSSIHPLPSTIHPLPSTIHPLIYLFIHLLFLIYQFSRDPSLSHSHCYYHFATL